MRIKDEHFILDHIGSDQSKMNQNGSNFYIYSNLLFYDKCFRGQKKISRKFNFLIKCPINKDLHCVLPEDYFFLSRNYSRYELEHDFFFR